MGLVAQSVENLEAFGVGRRGSSKKLSRNSSNFGFTPRRMEQQGRNTGVLHSAQDDDVKQTKTKDSFGTGSKSLG